MHVLIAHASAELYGSDRQVLLSAVGLQRAGVRVTVALPVDGVLRERLGAAGIRAVVLDTAVVRRKDLRPAAGLAVLAHSVASVLRQIHMLRRLGADVLVVNTVVIPTWLVAARLARVPAVCHVHEADGAGRLVNRILLAPLWLARAVVVNSAASQEFVRGAWPGLQRRVEIVYNGVPGPTSEVSAHKAPGSPPLILLPGRLAPRKGQDIAIEALARLVASGVPARMVLAGSVFAGYEWFEKELRSLAGRLQIADAVDFVGFVADLTPLYEAADVVVIPSRLEPFGNVAVEALMHKRPVIASAVQGLREIIEPGTTGHLVPAESSQDLAATLREVLTDPAGSQDLAERGSRIAKARFGVDRYEKELLRVVMAAAG